MKFLKILLLAISIMIGMYLYCTDYSGKTLKYWVQPKDIHYGSDNITYRLSVVETTRVLGVFLANNRHHKIFISKQSVKPELDMMYGHYKEYGFIGDAEDVKKNLSRCRVEWGNDGVWFIEPNGHKLFFPKSSFIGGR